MPVRIRITAAGSALTIPMPVHNADIAALFEEIADRLEIEGANPFRIRAYRNAARQLQSMGVAVASMVAQGEKLTEFPGIGEDLAAKIQEIVESGKCQALEKLRKKMPPAVTQLLQIPGLGPKRVRTLYHELDVQTLEQLARAALDGRIRALAGFGPKTEAAILQRLEAHIAAPARFKLAIAAQYAEPLKDYLEKGPGAKKVVIAGSYRRCRETVGDIDILVSASRAPLMMDYFVAYDEVEKVVSKGSTRSTVILKSGLQVDLRVVGEESFGAALQYFTGSKAHNIEIRRRAQERTLKISEYGVYSGERRIAGDAENRCTGRSVCHGSRRSCARTAARSRPRKSASCPGSSSGGTSKATCTPIPRQPTGTIASGRWYWRRLRGASSISPSPSTRAGSPSRTGSTRDGCAGRSPRSISSTPSLSASRS